MQMERRSQQGPPALPHRKATPESPTGPGQVGTTTMRPFPFHPGSEYSTCGRTPVLHSASSDPRDPPGQERGLLGPTPLLTLATPAALSQTPQTGPSLPSYQPSRGARPEDLSRT